MDGPRGYHAKRNKSDGERQVSYDSTHMRNLKKKKKNKQTKSRIRPVNTENTLMVVRGNGGKEMSKISEGERETQASSYEMYKSQR